jgi:endoglucanase
MKYLLSLLWVPALVPGLLAADRPDKERDAFHYNRLLGRGINLGNIFEAPREGEWGLTLRDEFFPLIRKAGFDAVRIPVRWSAHAQAKAPYRIDAKFLARIDWAVDQALKQELTAVLNIHHYEEMYADPRVHKERFLALWKQIAEHFKDRPDRLYFELLNEPHGKLDDATWNASLKEALAIVRASNPKRAVIVGPGMWNNAANLKNLKLPADDRLLIVTFHYYNPFHFTHQGAEWVKDSGKWLGTRWQGTPKQKQAVLKDLEAAAQWAKKEKRPLFLGEFGAYAKADLDSRARWTAFIREQAEQRGMSWAYWEFASGFGAYDREAKRWRQPLLSALVPK